MTTNTKPPSGMRDFLPQDVARRDHVIDVIRQIYSRYGFVPIETPAIENLTTLLGKYGEEGDQLLYRLLHRRDHLSRALALPHVLEHDLADQGLRYDLTVPLARVVAGHDLPRFFKRYQIQPVWRADRPGHGRFREFWQCDVDITGTSSISAEAEVISAVAEVLQTLGFQEFKILINHRETLRAMSRQAEIDPSLENNALTCIDKLQKTSPEEVRSELLSQGISPSSANTLITLTQSPSSINLAPKEFGELLQLCKHTPAANHIQFSPSLARGLTYYTGSIFEISTPTLNSSLGGGGRYDNLIGMFGKKQIPAVGFSLGLERILITMPEPNLHTGPDLILCWLPPINLPHTLSSAHSLRQQNLRVEVYPEPAKLRRQLSFAHSSHAPFAAILFPDSPHLITLKNLRTHDQIQIPIEDVHIHVKTSLERATL